MKDFGVCYKCRWKMRCMSTSIQYVKTICVCPHMYISPWRTSASMWKWFVFVHICEYHLKGLLRLCENEMWVSTYVKITLEDFWVCCKCRWMISVYTACWWESRGSRNTYINMYIYMNRCPYTHVYIYIYIHYVDNLNVHRLLMHIERQP